MFNTDAQKRILKNEIETLKSTIPGLERDVENAKTDAKKQMFSDMLASRRRAIKNAEENFVEMFGEDE